MQSCDITTKGKKLAALTIAVATATTGGAVGATGAHAAVFYLYSDLAGGSVVYGLNGVVTSGYTAASALQTTEAGQLSTNQTLAANVTNLADAGVIHTSVGTTAVSIGPTTGIVRTVGGGAFVARAFATVGGAINVLAGPVAANALPPTGTGGKDRTNSTLGVTLAPIATASVASTTVNGDTFLGLAYAENSARVTGLNLLGGAIRAQVLEATAFATHDDSGYHLAQTANIVNLKVRTLLIPVTTAPNTALTIPGLARFVVNEQSNVGGVSQVCALDVILTTAAVGLPAGAQIQVGCTSAFVV